ncbi:MAG: efflux RND transporter periplasmic adaptor subunit [Propionibacteriaceae bacterium]|nr:efflux RND transporter periplasmic adaptor subunit [Propionibacteriaceae bacterium]
MKLKKLPKRLVVVIVATAVVISAVVGWRLVADSQASQTPDTLARQYDTKKGDITSGVTGQGIVRYDRHPQAYAQTGLLGGVLVQVGQQVKAGDRLAVLDEKALDDALDAARDELEKALIGLEQARSAKTLGELNDKKNKTAGDSAAADTGAQVAQAQSAVDAAKSAVTGLEAQLRQLQGQLDALSADDPRTATLTGQRDQLQTQLDAARNQLQTAEANLVSQTEAKNRQDAARQKQDKLDQQIAGANSTSLDQAIGLAQVDVDAARKKVDQLQALKDNPYLTSDRDGVVLSIDAKIGDEVGPTVPVTSLGDPGKKQIVLQIPQSDIGKVTEGQEVDFTLDAFGDRKFTGRVTSRSLVPIKDSNPVAYEVVVTIDGNDADILHGMTANATLIIKQKKDVLQLSNKAIRLRDGKQYVNRKNADGTYAEVEITTGFSDGKVSEILNGLTLGDTVVVEG